MDDKLESENSAWYDNIMDYNLTKFVICDDTKKTIDVKVRSDGTS